MTTIEDRIIAAQSDLYASCRIQLAQIITPDQLRRLEEIERNPTGHAAHTRGVTYRKRRSEK